MSNRIKNTRRNLLVGSISKIVFTVLPFLIRTVILWLLGVEYMGLGSLRKRSPKKLIQFIVFACILELFDTIAGKMGDYLFFMDTDWTSYFVNAAAILCVIQGVRLFFSKKKVIEISFLSKRFCVDERLFRNEDINRLHQMLLKLR